MCDWTIERLYQNDKGFVISKGEAVFGWLHWREWSGGREGYQFCPNTCTRSRSRVLRDNLFDALTKGARLKASTARALINAVESAAS